MTNSHYRKGRRKEYKIVQQEKNLGRLAFRSAGSHSPIDVVSIDRKNRIIRLIQSKTYEITDKTKKKMQTKEDLDGVYHVWFEIR